MSFKTNSGESIKSLMQIIYAIYIVIGVITGIGMTFATSPVGGIICGGLIILFGWIGCIFFRAFGDLVSNSFYIRKEVEEQTLLLEKQTDLLKKQVSMSTENSNSSQQEKISSSVNILGEPVDQ